MSCMAWILYNPDQGQTRDWRKDRPTDTRTEIWGHVAWVFWWRRCTTCKLSMSIVYSWTGSWGYCSPPNEEAGLAGLVGAVSVGGQSSGYKYLEVECYVDIFCKNTQHLYSDPRKALPWHAHAISTHSLGALVPLCSHHPSKCLFLSSQTETLLMK